MNNQKLATSQRLNVRAQFTSRLIILVACCSMAVGMCRGAWGLESE